jgi:hypothetical protein
MPDIPGGSGLLVRDSKGKEADRLITRIGPSAVPLVAELRGHERQAVEELGQRKTVVEERKTASPARDQTGLPAMVGLPEYSPPMPWPPTGDRGWMT